MYDALEPAIEFVGTIDVAAMSLICTVLLKTLGRGALADRKFPSGDDERHKSASVPWPSKLRRWLRFAYEITSGKTV